MVVKGVRNQQGKYVLKRGSLAPKRLLKFHKALFANSKAVFIKRIQQTLHAFVSSFEYLFFLSSARGAYAIVLH